MKIEVGSKWKCKNQTDGLIREVTEVANNRVTYGWGRGVVVSLSIDAFQREFEQVKCGADLKRDLTGPVKEVRQ